jgi:exosortase A-associated hydrolase 2
VKIRQEALYLPLSCGDRFCVWRAPAGGAPTRGVVLHAPAFAEEMNKSRRMTAWAARELAAQGFGVLQVDLLGCGDSSGDFGDSSWERWIDDLLEASAWVRQQGTGPFWLWGLRAGALLVSALLPKLPHPAALLLWQPVLSGKQQLTQFLRLALASEMLNESADRQGTKQLRERLNAGETLEIAGYRLAPALALGLENASLSIAPEHVVSLSWLEIGSSPDVTPAARSAIRALQDKGVRVEARSVIGPSFWQTVEIEDCPAVVEATLSALSVENDRELSRDSVLL